MQQASANVDVLNSPDNVKILGNVLKTNVAMCSSVGSPFIIQITRIYMDMLGLYKAVSGLISSAVAAQGEIATKTPRVRALRTIKKEILKFIEAYVSKAEDLQLVAQNLIPPLLEAVLGDYMKNVEAARDAEVLSVFASIVTRLKVSLFFSSEA
jgi:exportin-1